MEKNKGLRAEIERLRHELEEMEEAKDLEIEAVTKAHAHQRNVQERSHVEESEKLRKEYEEILRMKTQEFEEKLRRNDLKHKQTHVILLSQLEKTKARLRQVLEEEKGNDREDHRRRRLSYTSPEPSTASVSTSRHKELSMESKAAFWTSRRDASVREEERRRK
eukprot:g6057.t1